MLQFDFSCDLYPHLSFFTDKILSFYSFFPSHTRDDASLEREKIPDWKVGRWWWFLLSLSMEGWSCLIRAFLFLSLSLNSVALTQVRSIQIGYEKAFERRKKLSRCRPTKRMKRSASSPPFHKSPLLPLRCDPLSYPAPFCRHFRELLRKFWIWNRFSHTLSHPSML